jgi:hypothetical protein
MNWDVVLQSINNWVTVTWDPKSEGSSFHMYRRWQCGWHNLLNLSITSFALVYSYCIRARFWAYEGGKTHLVINQLHEMTLNRVMSVKLYSMSGLTSSIVAGIEWIDLIERSCVVRMKIVMVVTWHEWLCIWLVVRSVNTWVDSIPNLHSWTLQ